KKLIPVCVVSTLALGGLAATITNTNVQAAENERNNDNREIKNVIFLIGDGMGSTYTSGYRYFKDDPSTVAVERTVFDKYLVGQQMTYPEDPT
ncbi:alkaline phosphatase, partial [Leptospira santarosai]|nr:alkaline phosphatase [Leptospira santarosai]